MNKALKITAFWLVLSGVAFASLKVWSTGEIVRSTDLNANFSELNTTKIGGSVKLTNSDVSASAAIAHSKMATPALLPKVWAYVAPSCSSNPCTIAAKSGVNTITYSGTGSYVVNLTSARANTAFGIIATANTTGAARYCVSNVHDASTVYVNCLDDSGVSQDVGFTVMILDNDN